MRQFCFLRPRFLALKTPKGRLILGDYNMIGPPSFGLNLIMSQGSTDFKINLSLVYPSNSRSW